MVVSNLCILCWFELQHAIRYCKHGEGVTLEFEFQSEVSSVKVSQVHFSLNTHVHFNTG